MKKHLFFIVFIACSSAYAQQFSMTDKERTKHAKEVAESKEKGDCFWDYDTVFNKGLPYCLLYKVDKGALHHDDYSVRNLAGQEIIYVKYATYNDYTVAHAPNTPPPTVGYYSYIFTDTKSVGEVLVSKVYKELIKNNLIDSGKHVNSKAEKLFVELNGNRYSSIKPPPPSSPLPPNYIMTERNHSAGITIVGENIMQDGKAIGRIQYGEGTVNGITTKTMDIFLPNGTRVAQAYSYSNQPHTWSITTFRDYYRNNVISQGDDSMDVVKYLIYSNYL